MRRSLPHPAVIALGAIVVVASIGMWWNASSMLELQQAQQQMQWSGNELPPEVITTWAYLNFAYTIVMPALATAAAASALGLVLVWIARARERSTSLILPSGSAEPEHT